MIYKPMLAMLGRPFSDPEWIFESKWDGIRAISYVNDNVRILSRSGIDISMKFPEISKAVSESTGNVVIDGEIVLVKNGKQDFQTLMQRFQSDDKTRISILSEEYPAVYVVFDILEVNDKPIINQPLEERRRILFDKVNDTDTIKVIKFIKGDGVNYFKAARSLGFEGIMAKKLGSPYEPGKRSNNWLKIKKTKTLDVIVLGYKPGQGSREGTFGSLEIGAYYNGKLVNLGFVGTGFNEGELKLVKGLVESKKKFVIEVEYQEMTKDWKLRMPRFVKLRLDKEPEECEVIQ